tara:strand:- start:14381 stop:15145 length:765 start_codon:yes stop_codon:yes gene_type:complete
MIYFFTGAGLSAESGVPTFRDAGGHWQKFDPQVLADITTFEDNYDLVHEFYNSRRTVLESIKPNTAHEAIAKVEMSGNAFVMTTNVDDLLERAGCKDVQHIHGNIREVVHGYRSGDERVEDIGYTEVDITKFPVSSNEMCKPNVIFFGEHAPEYESMFNTFTNITEDDLLIIIGCSETVLPAVAMASQSPKAKNVLFVNSDAQLCNAYKNHTNVTTFNCTATKFFQDIKYQELAAFKHEKVYKLVQSKLLPTLL